jgi:hypothetical protein
MGARAWALSLSSAISISEPRAGNSRKITMLNKLSALLAVTTVVVLSIGLVLANPSNDNNPNNGSTMSMPTTGQAGYNNGYNYGYDDGFARRDRDARYRVDMYHAQPTNLVAVDLEGIAFGYSDGYWDNGHRWHKWHRSSDMRAYRDRNGSNYHNYQHDRDGSDGWQR